MFNLNNIKEAFFAALLVIVFTIPINFIVIKYDLLKFVKKDIRGLDIYDLYFGEKNNNSNKRDTNIVIVQIEDERDKIAQQINTLEKYAPAIIGIDAEFKNKKDPAKDAALMLSFENNKNIAYANHFDTIKDQLVLKENFFENDTSVYPTGYINLSTDTYGVVRSYYPFKKIDGSECFAFTSRIAQLFSPSKFNALKNRNNEEETINYKGSISRYTLLTKDELITFDRENQLGRVVKNKIVLLGNSITYQSIAESDLHYSPMNSEFGEKGVPDMYGVAIHANILSMILNNKYSRNVSTTISILLAFVFVFLLLLYRFSLYSENNPVSPSKILLIQFFTILILLYFFLQVYKLYSWRVPLLSILISLVLCMELLKVYRLIALWLHKKINYKTVFTYK